MRISDCRPFRHTLSNTKANDMVKLKYLFAGILILVLSGAVIFFFMPEQEKFYTLEKQYLTMRDDVQIATYALIPKETTADATVPTVIRSSRYPIAFQNAGIEELLSADDLLFVESGYALVLVSVRGSGASGGERAIVWSSDEVADLGEVVEWITQQDWSNGRIGSYGVSYDGNTAELLTVPNHPAVRAVAPLYNDFDPFAHVAMPGGVFNRNFIEQWSASNVAMDTNDICTLAEISGIECFFIDLAVPGPMQMDNDADGSILANINETRQNFNVFEAMQSVTYRDDSLGAGTFGEVSPYGLQDAIESSGVPMYVQVSWLDGATVDGALARYQTFSNPQQLIIGAWNHGGELNTDPFLPDDAATNPEYSEQFAMRLAFFDNYLRAETPVTDENSITYYTMNAGTWTTTDVFPPETVENQRWYFAEDNSLSTTAPDSSTGQDVYSVDFEATTGELNRWNAQLGGDDVIYEERSATDERLLTYTSPPFETDTEITGHAIVSLQVSSTHEDGAFYVYLENVAPDGTVTYITEGILRGIHRAIDETPLYNSYGVSHSLNREDASPLVPGEVTDISFNLYATSVLIEAGHSIRVAIAGHDASMFERYPAEGTPTLSIERNSIYASYIDLPVVTP